VAVALRFAAAVSTAAPGARSSGRVCTVVFSTSYPILTRVREAGRVFLIVNKKGGL
jgi:hypothetical protein